MKNRKIAFAFVFLVVVTLYAVYKYFLGFVEMQHRQKLSVNREQTFLGCDQNGDGVISLTEWSSINKPSDQIAFLNHISAFRDADLNHDEALNRREFVAVYVDVRAFQ